MRPTVRKFNCRGAFHIFTIFYSSIVVNQLVNSCVDITEEDCYHYDHFS